MDFEEEHLDLLQNIEFAIVTEYRADQSVLDLDVRDALEALASASLSGRGAKAHASKQSAGRPQQQDI